MKPTLICLRIVFPDDTFVLGFHLELSSGLCQSYIPVWYRPIKYYTIGRQKCDLPRAARTAGPPLVMGGKLRTVYENVGCAILPDTRNTAYITRRRNHPYELPYYHYTWSRCSFVNRSLYDFIRCMVFILYHFELIYKQCLYNVFSCMHIYVLLFELNKDQAINYCT